MNKILEYILHCLYLLWKWLFPEHTTHTNAPSPARELRHQILSEENNMVKYKLTWVPSPSPWATTQTVKGTVNGAAQTFLNAAALSVAEVDVTFAESDVVDWLVSTVGENGLSADSVHDSFTASNLSVPAPATGLGHTFVEFVP